MKAVPDEGDLLVEGPDGFRMIPDTLLLDLTLTDLDVRLYGVLIWHGRGGNGTYPGRKKLAERLGKKSVRTIDAALERLQKAGYLTIIARFSTEGGQMRNLYRLSFTPIPPGQRQIRQHTGPRTSGPQDAEQPPVQQIAPGEGATDCTGPRAAECTDPVQQIAGENRRDTNEKREEKEDRHGAAGAAQRLAPAAPSDGALPLDGVPGKSTDAATVKKPRAASRATPAPAELPVTAAMRAWARGKDITVNLAEETEQFLDFHRAKGTEFRDWTAAWRTWMRNTKKFGFGGGRGGRQLGNHYTGTNQANNDEMREAWG